MAFNNFLNFVIAEEIEFVGERFTLNLERRLLRDNSNPFDIDEELFIKYFRLNKNRCRILIEDVRPHVLPGQRSTKIALELKVLSVLYFYQCPNDM
ncbi:hypothetical protein RN001_005177 [Aquatica leii]|uniref:Uncharacterized protein n=1 Tax=Aquatica leii TaxID=1421715 RepID=A0AAN7PCG0_9COLE|nr:hypothetical protein RN001_005177 [Aquatica leii]